MSSVLFLLFSAQMTAICFMTN